MGDPMIRRRRYAAEVILEEWQDGDEVKGRGLDYDTWKSIVVTSFARKSGYSRNIASAFLDSKTFKFKDGRVVTLRSMYDDRVDGRRRNPEAVAKLFWCKFKGTKKSSIC
jgi:hypothetical protein